MKLFRITMILVLAITALGLGAAPAQAAGRFTYMSSILVQNLDSVAGNISLTFYKPDGTVAATVTDPIEGNGQKNYFPLPSSVGDTFNGSVVITSETNVASVSNVHGGQGGDALYASGAYVAQSTGDTTISIPLLMKGNGQLNTWFNVQNAGTGNANVDITYTDGTVSNDNVIMQGAALTFDQAAEAHNAKVFAATVTSDQPIVITVIEESSNILYAYNGFTQSSGAKFPVFPLFHANNSGYFTAINLQNQGTDATEVTISYTPSSFGTACTETKTIEPGANGVFGFPFAVADANSDCVVGEKFVGSAVVTDNTGDNNLVAVVNQWNGSINGGAYNGFNIDAATGKVVLPLIFDRYSNYWTSAGFRNVGSVDTTVTCTFSATSATGGQPVTKTTPLIKSNECYTLFHQNLIAEKYIGSASCVADVSGAKIIAIVNELGPSLANDQLLVYEGINALP